MRTNNSQHSPLRSFSRSSSNCFYYFRTTFTVHAVTVLGISCVVLGTHPQLWSKCDFECREDGRSLRKWRLPKAVVTGLYGAHCLRYVSSPKDTSTQRRDKRNSLELRNNQSQCGSCVTFSLEPNPFKTMGFGHVHLSVGPTCSK